MKRICLLFLLTLTFVTSQAQILQPVTGYGYKWLRGKFDTTLSIPKDTLNIKADYKSFPHIAAKGDSVYLWSTYLQKWKLYSGGSGSTYVNTDNLDSVLTRGGAVTGTKTIDASTGTLVFDGSNYLAPGLGTGTKTDSLLTIRVADGKIRKLGYKGFGLITQTDADGLYGSLAQQNANTAAIQQRIDSLRNVGGVLQARKGGVFVPQFTLPTITSYGKNTTRDSTVLLLSNGIRFAAKDSIGSGGGAGWGLTGNSISAGTDFLGTTNNASIRFRTNNILRGYIDTTGSMFLTNRFANNDIILKTSTDGNIPKITCWNPTFGGNIEMGYGNFGVGGGQLALSTTGPQAISFYTNSNDRGRFSPSGNLLIGTSTDLASSKLTVNSTSQGVLLPRMTTTQKLAISSPAEGLEVYDLTLHQKSYFNGTIWVNY